MASPEEKEGSTPREEPYQYFFLTQTANRYYLTAAGVALDNSQRVPAHT